MQNQVERRVLVEGDHGVDDGKSSENITSLGERAYRARRSLQALDGCVAVDADDECVPFPPCREQNIHVPGVQEVEHAIREY